MSMQKIVRKGVSDEIYNQLLKNITNRVWKPGDRIPSEMDLVDLLGVSRVSIRDAIQRLVGMNLLTIRRGEGTFVSEILPSDYFENLLPIMIIDQSEYLDMQQYRLMIEPQIARLAALKASDEDIKKLRESVSRHEKLLGKNNELLVEDMNFHNILAECTGNKLVVRIHRMISDVLETAIRQAYIIMGYEGGIKFHTSILNAIENHNPVEAERNMREHIKYNFEVNEKADYAEDGDNQ